MAIETVIIKKLSLKEMVKNTADNKQILRETIGEIVRNSSYYFTGDYYDNIGDVKSIGKKINEYVKIQFIVDDKNGLKWYFLINSETENIIGWMYDTSCLR